MLLAAFLVTQVANAITTSYLHRGLTHRALTVHPVVNGFCRFYLWVATGMRVREWVAVHRKHHAFTDQPEDPHSPAQVGFWRVQLGNVGLYRTAARDPENIRRYAKDLPQTTLDRWFLDRAFLGLAVGTTILTVFLFLIGFPVWVGLLAALIHAFSYIMLSGSINAVGHWFGKRPYDNSATNNQWLALMTAGEGLHNNHHAAPTSARFSLHDGELDPGWWLIATLRRLHLAEVRHDEVHLKRAA